MAKFCIQCGATLDEGARFCGDCGASVPSGEPQTPIAVQAAATVPDSTAVPAAPLATPSVRSDPASQGGPAYGEAPEEPAAKKPNWLLIGGGVLILAILLLYYVLFLRDDFGSNKLEDRVASSEDNAVDAAPKQLFAMTQANIRDKATAQGSNIIGKLSRGTQVSGKVILGEDGTSEWLELADGKGFVATVNLGEAAPPEIVKPLGDKQWTTDKAIEIWSKPDTGSTLIDRVSAGTTLTLAGLTANDFIEVKLKKGGVGYIADGANIAERANGKPIALAFNPGSCSFGPEIDALFSKMGDRIRAKYKDLENKEYPSEEAREKALVSAEGGSTYEKLQRSYEGLTVTAIAQHYESQSVYFAEPASKVIEIFRSKGYKIAKDGSIAGTELYAGIGSTAGESARFGKADLTCGV